LKTHFTNALKVGDVKTSLNAWLLFIGMKYLEFLWLMDILYRFYPRYYSNEILILADDVWKWMNNELPEDSSTIVYLKSCFQSPTDALRQIWNELQLLAKPYIDQN
jgi:hypothetical protein